jgi:hypothetical protein
MKLLLERDRCLNRRDDEKDLVRPAGWDNKALPPAECVDLRFRTSGSASTSCTAASDGSTVHIVVPTRFGTYYTSLQALVARIQSEVETFGRLSVQELTDLVGAASSSLVVSCLQKTPGIAVVQDTVMADSYLKMQVDELVLSLCRGNDKLLVSHVARQWDLPMAFALSVLQSRLDPSFGVQILTQHNGSKALVTAGYLQQLEIRFCGALLAVSQRRVTIEQVCSHHHIDEPGWVQSIVVPHLDKKIVGDELVFVLPGEFHGNLYIPTSYTHQQRHAALDCFLSNGFLTLEHGQRKFGIPPSTVRDYLQQAYSDSAICLSESIVHRDVLVASLEAAVQEAVSNEGWIDLTPHVPPDLLSLEDDCRTLLVGHIIEKNNEFDGIPIIFDGRAVFMCQAMVQHVLESTIVPLVEPWAKSRARELDATPDVAVNSSPGTIKEGRKSRRSHSKKSVAAEKRDFEFLPLSQIIESVTAAYPDLSSTVNNKHFLSELCEQAFCVGDNQTMIQSICERAVQAELRRLASERASRVIIRHKDSAAKSQDIQVSFEDPSCFPIACYLVQGFASFLEYAEAACHEDSGDRLLSESDLSELKRDFLLGCGAEFTRRVTLYCCFKNELDDSKFSFRGEPVDGTKDEYALPHFCSPISLVTRQYARIFFSCSNGDEMSDTKKGPLETLRAQLPTTVGTSLARQWILCGAECYRGGTKAGSLEGFLRHVEENCLTVCGVPFKRMDKKAKKQFFNSRRQLLVQALESETDAGACLDYAVMLLYQLFKNHIVFGSHLRGPILYLLKHEKKMTDEVSAALQSLVDQIVSGDTVELELIMKVKAYALSKK